MQNRECGGLPPTPFSKEDLSIPGFWYPGALEPIPAVTEGPPRAAHAQNGAVNTSFWVSLCTQHYELRIVSNKAP